jgi:hypothetical protein
MASSGAPLSGRVPSEEGMNQFHLLLCCMLIGGGARAAWLNESNLPGEADFAVLQFPASFSSGPASPQIYGRLNEAGITEAPGSPAGVIAQVGYGPAGTDPRTNSGWQWFPASYNLQAGNDDEYAGALAFTANGTYSYTFRFSMNNGTDYTLADLNGAGSTAGADFSPAQLGTATVTGIVALAVEIRRTVTNTVALSWPTEVGTLYTLLRGETVTSISTPVNSFTATSTTSVVVEPISAATAFYRVIAGAKPTPAGLVINEVDYDSVDTDTMEFIELLNTSSNSVDLSSTAVVLLNGASSLEYARVPLSGTLPAGFYLVIASANVVVPAGATVIRIPDNLVQNGSPDGIVLFDLANHLIVDVLSYEGAMTTALITGEGVFNVMEGAPLEANIADSNTEIASLARIPNGRDTDNANVDWTLVPTPTPGAANGTAAVLSTRTRH